MPNMVNTLVASEYTGQFKEAEALVIFTMAGLTVAENESLRSQMAEGGVQVRMIRNSLAKRVLSECGYEFEDGLFVGNLAVAWGSPEGAIHAAKVASTPEVKKTGKVQLKAGVLEGNVLGPADASALADVPDKDTLRSKIVGCIQGPMRGLAASLAGLPGGLARVLQAHVDQGEGEA